MIETLLDCLKRMTESNLITTPEIARFNLRIYKKKQISTKRSKPVSVYKWNGEVWERIGYTYGDYIDFFAVTYERPTDYNNALMLINFMGKRSYICI
jgi:hypothetical protein